MAPAVAIPIPVNGINGHKHQRDYDEPQISASHQPTSFMSVLGANGPSLLSSSFPTGHSLTEYSADPLPEPEDPKKNIREMVPEQYLQADGYPDYLKLINSAKVHEVCAETPLDRAHNLSLRLDCEVLLKREDTHPIFSFKLRGAYNKMRHLPPEASWKGVICCSAGNHAQGVAYSAKALKIPATVVMPEGTPAIKHRNVTHLGAQVVMHGADFDEAKEECMRRQKAGGLIMIHPFDDPYTIAGQGTIGMELMKQTDISKIDAVFCAVGGGGLISGVGVFLKQIAPHVRIIGVEAYDANAMAQSLEKKERVLLPEVGLFADGAAIKIVGEENFRICKNVIDEIVQVTTDEVCAAIKDFYEDTRSVCEPAGALSLAGLKKWVGENPSPNSKRGLVAVMSGANMNFDRLRFVAQRATLGEGKEVLLRCTIPERPGSFVELLDAVLPHAVTEFVYRYGCGNYANVLLGLSLAGPVSQHSSELETLTNRMKTGGMQVTDLSQNEFAKSSLRYLIGGRSNVPDERIYMFRFPERRGALIKFLMTLRPKYNISLFQYRNEGADVSTVTAAMLCPESEIPELEKFLDKIGYPYTDCTNDEEYRVFLRA